MKVKVKYSSTETDDDNNSKAKKRPHLNVSSDESDDPGNDFFFLQSYIQLYLICKHNHKCFYLLYK